jgi:hypothetical protein
MPGGCRECQDSIDKHYQIAFIEYSIMLCDVPDSTILGITRGHRQGYCRDNHVCLAGYFARVKSPTSNEDAPAKETKL